tara:strand:- start:306 stop:626 length:321 start_codon:yes stop_codon:yes gene_type:complete
VEKTKSCGPLVTEAFTDSKLCGCYMPAKTKLKTASCPLGKWDAYIKPEEIDRIREFLERDNEQRTKKELTELVAKYIHPSKRASTCPPCNRQLLQDLEKIVNSATT